MNKILQRLIQNNIKENQWYIEPFGGGMNCFSAVNHPLKIVGDINPYLIAFWQSVQNGTFSEDKWNFCKNLTEEEYYSVKEDCLSNGKRYDDDVKGYVAFACSYGGGWWNGYAHFNPKKNENHILEAYNGTIKQISEFKELTNSKFIQGEYMNLPIPENSFIYCDPPYANTKDYVNSFDSKRFWKWAEAKVKEGNVLMISEYTAPEGWVCIWEKDMQDGMASVNSIKKEKIFIHSSQTEFKTAI